MDDIILTRQFALQQAVNACRQGDYSSVVNMARYFAAFLDPANNLAPVTPEEARKKALDDVLMSIVERRDAV